MKALRYGSASISNSRWLAYTTAGVASAFAAANSAEATIHYSGPIHRNFKGCQAANFRLDQPADFIRLKHSSFLLCDSTFNGNAFFNVAGISGASIAGFYNECGHVSASNLKRGQLISSRPFVPAQTFRSASLAGKNDVFCPGQFLGGIGFIGFKFNNGSGAQYGWARIQVQPGASHHFKLIDYAYGDVGDTVGAGQKSGHDKPELESLGGLALGALGLLAWRKSRVRAAQ